MTSTAIPSPKGETLTLRQAAERLMGLASKIERASSEDEENRLCDERDALLAMMRKADAILSTSSSEDVRREALEEAAKVVEESLYLDMNCNYILRSAAEEIRALSQKE